MNKLLLFSICLFINCQIYSQETIEYPFIYEVSGTGEQSIILIPGFASSGKVWDETKNLLNEDYKCYTLTMAGFAGVEPNSNSSFENWKERIADFIIDKKLDKPIIIGHSMGGGLAMAIAADFPGLISQIVIVDALPCLAALSDPSFQQKEDNDCTAMISQFTSMDNEQFYNMQKMSMPSMMQNTEMLDTVVNWSVTSDRFTLGNMFCDFFNIDLRQRISTITCPTLVLLEAPFSQISGVIEEQFKNLRTSDLKYANKGLHFIMYDDKDWYFGQLANFIFNK